MQIEHLTANDFEEAMDFLNMVFSQADRPHDLVKMLPKLYRPTDECMSAHAAIRSNGRIRAIVGLYPMTLCTQDSELKVAGIGAVTSHPNDRGKGWMRMLMEHCLKEMQAEGFHLSCLGGFRHRYRYFGYEKAGVMLDFHIKAESLKHCQGVDTSLKVHFRQMEAGDLQSIMQAKMLHDSQPVYFKRPQEDFYRFLLSWNMQPWLAFSDNGNMVGYLVATPDREGISELHAVDMPAYNGIVFSWLRLHNQSKVNISLPSWALEEALALGAVADGMQVGDAGNWLVLDWQKIISSLLAVRSRVTKLQTGSMSIAIKGYGALRISVQGSDVICERTDKADIELDAMTAMRVAFGPVHASYVTELPEEIQILAASWFPLPLSWQLQDHV
jgi:predicted acetyltransferase